MAISRVGGTKAKIRGQVGQTIYQVKRNPDGTYTQYTYAKGERTEETLTPRLQAQRMCVAMVESLMKDLKPVARIAFQSAKTKNASLNAFSSHNLRLVMRDCQDHWYGGNTFMFPGRSRVDKEVKDLGGSFLISSGTLGFDLFDRMIHEITPISYYDGGFDWDQYLYGLYFDCRIGVETVSAFLARHRMTYLDGVVFCGFRQWYYWAQGDEDSVEYYRNDYCITTINQKIKANSLLTVECLADLFVLDSSIEFGVFPRKDRQGFVIGRKTTTDTTDEVFYNWAGFSISYGSGKKLISSSNYHNIEGDDKPWILDHYPAAVFGSWMGEPQVFPYPDPFSSKPAPRIPGDYQEVEYLESDQRVRFSTGLYFDPKRHNFLLQASKSGSGSYNILSTGTVAGGLNVEISPAAVVMQYFDNDVVAHGGSLSLNTVGVALDLYCDRASDDLIFHANDQSVRVAGADIDTPPYTQLISLWYAANVGNPCRVYSFQFWSNGGQTLFANMIPCYQHSNHMPGFYDLRRRHFYSLGSKSHLVTIGPDVVI